MNERKSVLRQIVLDVVFGLEPTQYPATQLRALQSAVAEVIVRRSEQKLPDYMPYAPPLSREDSDLVNEIAWDLIIERVITPGMDPSNCDLPWFRLTSTARQRGRSHYT
jgi:hypothetical protein